MLGGPLGCCPYLQLFKGVCVVSFFLSIFHRPITHSTTFFFKREPPPQCTKLNNTDTNVKHTPQDNQPIRYPFFKKKKKKGGKLIFTAPCSRDGSLPTDDAATTTPLSSSKCVRLPLSIRPSFPTCIHMQYITTTPSINIQRRNVTALPWAQQSDGSIIFNVDCAVQGDVLLRIRHLAAGGQKVGETRYGC